MKRIFIALALSGVVSPVVVRADGLPFEPATTATASSAALVTSTSLSNPGKPASIKKTDSLPTPSEGHSKSKKTKKKRLVIRRDKGISPVVLPGVGVIPGKVDQAMFNVDVINVNSDKTEVAYISEDFPTRISTPFKSPKLIGAVDGLGIKQVGNSLYLPSGMSDPVGVFITGSSPGAQVISLTLIPQPMPQQNIVLALNGGGINRPLHDDASGRKVNTYTQRVVEDFRAIALHKIPDGYDLNKLSYAVGTIGSLMLMPEARYSGGNNDVWEYRVENASTKPIEIHETDFYVDGVIAVAVYPKVRLLPHEQTYILVESIKSTTNLMQGEFDGLK